MRLLLAGALIGATLLAVLWAPQGAVVLVFTPTHGLHLGDVLLAVSLAFAVRKLGPWSIQSNSTRHCRHRVGIAVFGRPIPAGFAPVGLAFVVLGVLNGNELFVEVDPAAALGAAVCIVSLAALASLTFCFRDPHPEDVTGPGGGLAFWALLGGYVLDSVALPTGTAFGPALFAACLSRGRPGRVAIPYALLVIGLLALNLMSLADIAGVDVVLAGEAGGAFRTVALGTVLSVGALVEQLRGAQRSRRRAGSGAQRS